MTASLKAELRTEIRRIEAELERRQTARRQAEIAKIRAEQIAIWAHFAPRKLIHFVHLTHPGYQAGRFHHYLCDRLERFSHQVRRGKSPRLLISAPPRHGKTAIISQRFPVWHAARNPGHELACASYGQDLADDNSREARTIARSDYCLQAFGRGVLPKRSARRYQGDYQRGDVDKITMWKMGNGSSYKAVGVGGPLTGRGAHLLIIDDPFKDDKEARSPTKREAVWNWYASTARTRVAPGGGVIVMATRWDQDDLIGRIERKALADEEADQFEIINLPAIAEDPLAADDWRAIGEALHAERYSERDLRQIRATIGEYWWRALYMGRPTSASGGTFKRAWFRYYDKKPWIIVHEMGEVAISIDCAFKGNASSDRVSIQVWGRHRERPQHFYLLDEHTEQLNLPDTIKALGRMAARWPMAHLKLIEDAANGPGVIDLLDGRVNGLTPFSPGKYGSKKDRAQSASVAWEGRQVWLPRPEYASWIDEYELELTDFGEGALYDDRVDSASQIIIRWMGSTNPVEQVNAALGWLNEL